MKKKILDAAKDIGLDVVGFTRCRKFTELQGFFEERARLGEVNEFEEEDIEKRINPFLYMEDGKTIISIAFPYNNGGANGGFSLYTRGLDYHTVVKSYLEKICGVIEESGYKTLCFVDSNPLPERYIAYLCGNGFIGENHNFITEKYGSYVFLGEIITDALIEEDKPLQKTCLKCGRCSKICPTKTLKDGKYSPNRCFSYITQKKAINEEDFIYFQGDIFGCDKCQSVCPHNMNVESSKLVEFKPMDYMEKPDIKSLIFMDKKTFNDKYKILSCGWRGRNVIMRNALITYYNKNKADKDNIEKTIKSPYVMEYFDKLFNN